MLVVKMRFGFVPFLALIIGALGFTIGITQDRQLGGVIFIVAFILFSVGLMLIAFFPYKRDKSKVQAFHMILRKEVVFANL